MPGAAALDAAEATESVSLFRHALGLDRDRKLIVREQGTVGTHYRKIAFFGGNEQQLEGTAFITMPPNTLATAAQALSHTRSLSMCLLAQAMLVWASWDALCCLSSARLCELDCSGTPGEWTPAADEHLPAQLDPHRRLAGQMDGSYQVDDTAVHLHPSCVLVAEVQWAVSSVVGRVHLVRNSKQEDCLLLHSWSIQQQRLSRRSAHTRTSGRSRCRRQPAAHY